MDFSLLWPRQLSSSLGNSEVRCEVVNDICQLANQIVNFKTKVATSVPTKLVNSEFVLFFFFFCKGKTVFSSECNSLRLFC